MVFLERDRTNRSLFLIDFQILDNTDGVASLPQHQSYRNRHFDDTHCLTLFQIIGLVSTLVFNVVVLVCIYNAVKLH